MQMNGKNVLETFAELWTRGNGPMQQIQKPQVCRRPQRCPMVMVPNETVPALQFLFAAPSCLVFAPFFLTGQNADVSAGFHFDWYKMNEIVHYSIPILDMFWNESHESYDFWLWIFIESFGTAFPVCLQACELWRAKILRHPFTLKPGGNRRQEETSGFIAELAL